jgi:hypothetical protein
MIGERNAKGMLLNGANYKKLDIDLLFIPAF